MAHPNLASSKKRGKRRKKSRREQAQEGLSINNSVHITTRFEGVGGGGGPIMGSGMGDDDDGVMDCLEELATAQVGPVEEPLDHSVLDSSGTAINAIDGKGDNGNRETSPPSGILQTSDRQSRKQPSLSERITHLIPNLRIELARHLQTQTLSTFLLRSFPGGLRMPTFERWLLDSKLEETDRFQSIIVEWMDDPSLKLDHVYDGKMKKKKKYGRAAVYQQKKENADALIDARHIRETSRKERDRDLLLEAEKRTSLDIMSQKNRDCVGVWIRHLDRDPILPYQAIETDASCDRLLTEILAAMATTGGMGEELDQQQCLNKAKDIVRELCHRTAEACRDIQSMEMRFGKYQKFIWDTVDSGGAGSKRKKRKRDASAGGVSVDRINVEWHDEDRLCSLIYIPKKRKSKLPSSLRGGWRNERRVPIETPLANAGATDGNNQEDGDATGQHKPKPFVIKINASHYHKLRSMFDSTHCPKNAPTSATTSMKKEQATHSFHAALFATVIRYSSLSGGQQLNDWKGGGMQGAVHDGVFDCLSKWFRGDGSSAPSFGTECFASPFNSILPRFFSAFPSPDIDGHFGSHGDFFHPTSESLFLRPGSWYELNPPFSPGVMNNMAHRIGQLLEIAHREELDVTFVVIVPTVRGTTNNADRLGSDMKAKKKKKKKKKSDRDSKEGFINNNHNTIHQAASHSFFQLINSPYCRSHITLPAREHGYIEGGQHLRPTKYKESQSSTSVIVLKSSSCTVLPDHDAESFEKELRVAFTSRHTMEVEQRKERSKGNEA